MSNINRISNNPNVDISKLAWGLCKITLRNTTHVSDKAAYRNYHIRLLSEISVTIRTLAETEKKKKNMIGVLKNCKKDQKFIFSSDQNLYEIKEQ